MSWAIGEVPAKRRRIDDDYSYPPNQSHPLLETPDRVRDSTAKAIRAFCVENTCDGELSQPRELSCSVQRPGSWSPTLPDTSLQSDNSQEPEYRYDDFMPPKRVKSHVKSQRPCTSAVIDNKEVDHNDCTETCFGMVSGVYIRQKQD